MDSVILYIVVGGVLGTLARWYLQGWIQTSTGAGSFPLGTLLINIAGSLVLGFVARLGTGSTIMSPEVRGGLTIGLCGAFTTMSTFSYESIQLLGDGDYVRAALYMGGTIVGCLAAVTAGSMVAGRLL
ncbi:MAG TPA: fluoride efflux transporter CrcB [Gemmatimonadales bacterium]|jgi:CrcB protein|nr:fluoride efflux transporter CrcB [Gemmatimonadales bacterium]